MKAKKLFVFDLDGTLLNSDNQLSLANARALEQAKAQGHFLGIATGRNFILSKNDLGFSWNLFDYFSGSNGAVFHDIAQQTTIQANNFIDYQLVLDLQQKLEVIGGRLLVSTSDYYYTQVFQIAADQEYLGIGRKKHLDDWPEPKTMDKKAQQTIVQIALHVDPKQIYEIAEQLNQLYGQDYTVLITHAINIDINLKNVGKLSAIQQMQQLSLVKDENVYFFGDSQSDIPALEQYQNTYAMANGLIEAHKAAKHVIGSNDSDAISQVLLKAL